MKYIQHKYLIKIKKRKTLFEIPVLNYMCKSASALSKKATSPSIVPTDEEIKFISDKLGTSCVHELLTHLHS